jgi:curved DNA-binding protein CbpA
VSGAGDDPFAVLGLAARPDLSDDDVRAAWRRIAAATHPDRADGGDPERFAVAAAAYTVLRTRSGRGEALADLADRSGWAARAVRGRPGRPTPSGSPAPSTTRADQWADPSRAGPADARPLSRRRPGGARRAGAGLLSRIRRGRVSRLALRVVIAAAVSAGAAAVAGAQPATPALVVGSITWLLVTARNDLAPPR